MEEEKQTRRPRGRPPTRPELVRYRRREMDRINKALQRGDIEGAQKIQDELEEAGLLVMSERRVGRPVKRVQEKITKKTPASVVRAAKKPEQGKIVETTGEIKRMKTKPPAPSRKPPARPEMKVELPQLIDLPYSDVVRFEEESKDIAEFVKENPSFSRTVPPRVDKTTKGKRSMEQKFKTGKARRRAEREAVKKAQEEAFLREHAIKEEGGVVEYGRMPKLPRGRGKVVETSEEITKSSAPDFSLAPVQGELNVPTKQTGTVIDTLDNIGYGVTPMPETIDVDANRRQIMSEVGNRMINNGNPSGSRLRSAARQESEIQPTRGEFGTSGIDYGFNSGSVQGAPDDVYARSNIIDMPLTYNDDLVTTSNRTLLANNRNEYSGMAPDAIGQTREEQKYFDEAEEKEKEEDARNLHDTVREIEALSGAERDSLFNATDLSSARLGHISEDNIPTNYPLSGMDRGRRATNVPNVDLSNVSDLFDNLEMELPQQASEIGLGVAERLGDAYRFIYGREQQQIQGPSSIMENIDRIAELGNDWFGRGDYRDRPMGSQEAPSISDRFQHLNRRNINSGLDVGKYNHTKLSEKYIASQILNQRKPTVMSAGGADYKGAGGPSLGQLRGQEVEYRQPDRTYRGDAVNLLKTSNRTAALLENEFNP